MTSSTQPSASAGKPKVAVIFGGRSAEHAISCVTAASVLAAIDPESYEVLPIGIARDGRWVLEAADPERLALRGRDQLPSVDTDQPSVALMRQETHTQVVVHEAGQAARELGEVDVVFPLLHGPWGEDGTIQGMFEISDVRYVGAGVLASAVCMDKSFLKVVLQAAGLPVMPGITVTERQWRLDPEGCRARIAELGYPLFCKPARGGSSFGVSKVHDASELDEAIRIAQEHDSKVLFEVAAIGAREIEVGVIGTLDGGCETTRPAEIRIGGDHEFYDFEAKYLPEEHTELDVPAVVDADVEAQMRRLSELAFEAVSGEGLARVDFFLLPDNSVVINELNTMPGFTSGSLFPRMWAAMGLTYPDLIDRLIQLALKRSTGLR